MALGKLLVPMEGIHDETAALSTALAIGKVASAHIEALFLAADPAFFIGAGDYVSPSVMDEIIAEVKDNNEERRQRTKALFHELTKLYAAPINAQPGKSRFSADFVEITNSPNALENYGRLCDLIVLGKGGNGAVDRNRIIEAALRDTGRPVLFVNRPVPAGFAKTIAIAWNGSLEATRTVGYAMPLLERAEKVFVLTVAGDTWYGPSASELINYLAWHGISGTAVSIPSNARERGEALLTTAAKLNVDLMMLGAYTRGELRRLVFGGVTGALLANSSLPLLMMH